MRKPLVLLLALLSISAIAVAAAIAAPSRPTAATHSRVAVSAPKAAAPVARVAPAVKVVMRDPGCHWFAVGGKFKTKLAVTGAAKLSNFDEAALKIKGAHSVKRVNVGRTVALGRGAYTITMVDQPSDDNTLHLTVR